MNRPYIHIWCSSLALVLFVGSHAAVLGQEKDFNAYPDQVAKHLKRLYDPTERQLAFRADYPGGFEKWQARCSISTSSQNRTRLHCSVGRRP